MLFRPRSLWEMEGRYLKRVYARSLVAGMGKSELAECLGCSRSHLYRKLAEYKLYTPKGKRAADANGYFNRKYDGRSE